MGDGLNDRPIAVKMRRVVKSDDTASKQVDARFSELTGGLYLQPPYEPILLGSLYETCSTHAACVLAKKVDTVGHGWKLEPIDPNDNEAKERAPIQAEALKVLLAPIFSGNEDGGLCALTFEAAVESARLDAEIYGWGAWEVVRDSTGRIRKVYPIPACELRICLAPDVARDPSRVRKTFYVQVAEDGTYAFFVPYGSRMSIHWQTGQELAEGSPDENKAHEVILFHRYSTANRHYPVPEWVAGIPEMMEMRSISEFNSGFFESGGIVSSIVHVVGESDTESQRIATEIGASVAEAVKEQARTVVVTHGSQKSSIASSPIGKQTGENEADFMARDDVLQKRLLMIHQVPPYRIGLAEIGSLGGAPAREMIKTYRYSVVEPWQEVFELILEATIFSPQGLNLKAIGYRFRFEDLNWDQLEADMQKADQLSKLGAITPNEAREISGLKPVKDPRLDEYYFNGIPLGQNAFGAQAALPAEPEPDLLTPESSGQEPQVPVGASADYELDNRDDETYQKALDGEEDAEVAGGTSGLRAVFDAERDRVLAALRSAGGVDDQVGRAAAIKAVSSAIRESKLAMSQWLAATYQKTSDRFAQLMIERMAKVRRKSGTVRKAEVTLSQAVIDFLGGKGKAGRTVNAWKDTVKGWLKGQAGEKITGQIQSTTLDQVRKQLADGFRANEGIDDIAKRIDSLYLEQIIPNRSEVIARTEVISAANLGHQAAAKAMVQTSGFKLEKRWLATRDGRERPEHAAAETQGWIPYDQKFQVKDSAGRDWGLDFPGDASSGAPGEVTIQCRCRPVYRPVR